jgi:hypothetical protein
VRFSIDSTSFKLNLGKELKRRKIAHTRSNLEAIHRVRVEKEIARLNCFNMMNMIGRGDLEEIKSFLSKNECTEKMVRICLRAVIPLISNDVSRRKEETSLNGAEITFDDVFLELYKKAKTLNPSYDLS